MQILQIIYAKQISIQTLTQIVTAPSPSKSNNIYCWPVHFIYITYKLMVTLTATIRPNLFSVCKDIVETNMKSRKWCGKRQGSERKIVEEKTRTLVRVQASSQAPSYARRLQSETITHSLAHRGKV